MSLPEHERQVVYFTLVGPAAVGSMGCLFVIAMFASFRTLRSTSYMMIGILAGFDLVNGISFMLPTFGTENEDAMCQVQAVGLNFSTLGGLIWTTFMAIYLYLAIRSKEKVGNRVVFWSLLFTLLISTIFSIIPAVSYPENAYGKNHGWCWISGKYFILRDIVFFGPVLLIIPINFCIYLKVSSTISQILTSVEDQSQQKKIRSKLLLYPLILVICYLPYTVKAFLEFFRVDIDEFVFTIVSGILRCLHSFLNFCVYGMNASVQKRVKDCFTGTSLKNSLMEDSKQSIITMKSAVSFVY